MAVRAQENRFYIIEKRGKNMNIDWMEILRSIGYASIGIILMMICVFLFDLCVPYNFNKELKEKNVGAGFMIAGIFIAVAIIIRTVIK